MKQANRTGLLHFKNSAWWLLPANSGLSFAVAAAEQPVSREGNSATGLLPSLKDAISGLFSNGLPLDTVAWLSLTTMFALLFLSKRRGKPQKAHLG